MTNKSQVKQFTGTYTAIITPFNEQEEIDMPAFAKLVERQIAAGIDGIVVLGTTGESPTITPQEHGDLINETVKIVAGRTKVIAGTGSNSTAEAIHYSQVAKAAGVDCLLQVTPYYNKPTQKGLYQHFKAVAEAVDLPIILYNIAGRCGVNIATETVVKLSQIPNIVGVKEASGDLEQVKAVIAATPDDFTVLSGNDDQNLKIIKLGGDGAISVLSNIFPAKTKAYIDNKDEAAYQHLANLVDNLFIETNPIPVKTLLAEMGLCKEIFRLPMTIMEDENKKKLIASFKNLL